MKDILIDGYKFFGPYVVGKDDIPNVPAIALMCTEAGEGMKIMSVEDSERIAAFITDCPRMQCWKSKAYLGVIDVYLMQTDMPAPEREAIRKRIADKRRQYLFCERKDIVEDDW